MLYTFADRPSCIEALSEQICAVIRSDLAVCARMDLAVSGGRSPAPLFETLAKIELDWGRVRVRLVDERDVPPEHPDSNAALVRGHLLQHAAARAQFELLRDPALTLDQCVERANVSAGAADLLLLGLGDDGHVASLFPDAPEIERGLDAASVDDYLLTTPQHAPHRRIGMTLHALLRARCVFLFATGASKRERLRDAMHDAASPLPVARLLRAREVEMYWAP